MKEIKAYQCGFCAKCYAKPQAAGAHERACRSNPARKHCKTCTNSYMRRVGSETIKGHPGYPGTGLAGWPDIVINEDKPWCKIHNKPVHEKPYYDECEMAGGNYEPEYPLPGTCDHYSYKGFAGWGGPVYPEDEADAKRGGNDGE